MHTVSYAQAEHRDGSVYEAFSDAMVATIACNHDGATETSFDTFCCATQNQKIFIACFECWFNGMTQHLRSKSDDMFRELMRLPPPDRFRPVVVLAGRSQECGAQCVGLEQD
eukprot:4832753-Amphidinium_carterae.1